MCQIDARGVDYIRPPSGMSGTRAVCLIAEEWWILVLTRERRMQIFVTLGLR